MVLPHLKRLLPFAAPLILLLLNTEFIAAHAPSPIPPPTTPLPRAEPSSDPLVARIYFSRPAEIMRLASKVDIWEVQHGAGYIVAAMERDQFNKLRQDGYDLSVDEAKSANFNYRPEPNPGQVSGIPSFPCYRTVEETYADLEALSEAHPTLANWIDIGDSWEKITPAGQPGYDIFALVLTNQSEHFPSPKPKFFLMAAIHAREYATAELAARFAEHLVARYGVDADITWLLDYFEVHIVPITNPDGRKLAEAGYYQRKNTNTANGSSCAVPPEPWDHYGTDLNRNHTFRWGGASPDACSEIYQGPSAASEPETQAIETYLSTIFLDQRGPGDSEPAPPSSAGLLISLHSYGRLVLWPWGHTYQDPPNQSELRALGHKLAYFNYYRPQQSSDLYPTTGDTTDFSYGELGVAALTFEIGTDFFQDCNSFESAIYPDNLNALLYAFKGARLPYLSPSGPDSLSVGISPEPIQPDGNLLVTTTADDSRFYPGVTVESIAAARYSIGGPSWTDEAQVFSLDAADGSFDSPIEALQGAIDISSLSEGRHILFVESQDASGYWGVPSAAFFWVAEPPLPLFLPLVGK